jgi:multidrug efflux system membrane fusion protein
MGMQHWALAIGLGVGAGCAPSVGSAPADARGAGVVEDSVVVRVAAVVAPEPTRQLVVHGVTRSAQQAALSLPVGGRLWQRTVDVGEAVTVGQPLARLDPAPFEHQARAAQARVDELRSRLQAASADQQRMASLTAGRAVSDSELDGVDASVSALRAALAGAEAQLDEAERQLADSRLVAPYDGVVLSVGAEPGETVAPGQPLVQLSGLGSLEVEVQVPEAAWGQLQVGAHADVELVAVGQRTNGRVSQVGTAARPDGLFPLTVTLDDDGEGALRAAGLTARVALQLPVQADATLPLAAVVDPTGTAPAVLRVRDGVAERVAVTPVHLLAEGVAVRGGLQAGDEVVVSGHGRLLDGDAVQVLR